MVSFRVTFNKGNKVYKPGDIVSCQVHVQVNSEFKARSLSIRFLGKAHTEWRKSRTVTSNGKSRTVTETFTGNEEFFRYYHYLIGQRDGIEQQITCGSYDYEAAFQLPSSLPSSLEHHNGYIRYTVKINYDVPWGFDKEQTETFTINGFVNLNEFPYLREPVRETIQKTFGCCCCESDPMDLVNVLPRGGYAPGETMPVSIEVNNNSDVNLEHVRLYFKRSITFITRSPRTDTRTETETLSEYEFPTEIAPFQKRVFQKGIYLDPGSDWKHFEGCGIISCEYYVKSEAYSAGCHSNPENSTKVTIGSIPFAEEDTTNGGFPNVPLAPYITPSAPTEFNPMLPTNGPITEQPLPSYNDVAAVPMYPGSSGAAGWNLNVPGMRSPGSAPLASTEKIDLAGEDLPPPTFEESEKLRKEIETKSKPDMLDFTSPGPSAPPDL